MKVFSRNGFIMTRAHGSAVESGEPIQVGDMAVIAMGKYDANEEGEYVRAGVHELAKSSGLALVQGTAYDWDATNKEIVADTLGDFSLGVADADADAADEVGYILLNKLPYALN